jgi:hypothetical protein
MGDGCCCYPWKNQNQSVAQQQSAGSTSGDGVAAMSTETAHVGAPQLQQGGESGDAIMADVDNETQPPEKLSKTAKAQQPTDGTLKPKGNQKLPGSATCEACFRFTSLYNSTIRSRFFGDPNQPRCPERQDGDRYDPKDHTRLDSDEVANESLEKTKLLSIGGPEMHDVRQAI